MFKQIPQEKEIKLTIELVPQTSWFNNVRNHLSQNNWKKLSAITIQAAQNKCQICGKQSTQQALECHEIWHYDEENKIQRLLGLIALCSSCHEVKHFGLTQKKNREAVAVRHLAEVNGWILEIADEYVNRVFTIWRERSKSQWKLDISWLEKQGVAVKKTDYNTYNNRAMFFNGKDKFGNNALIKAIFEKNINALKKILAQKDLEVLPDEKDKHALLYGIESGDLTILKLLLQNDKVKSLINKPQKFSRLTPLILAAKLAIAPAVKLLLKHGSSLYALDRSKCSALHYSALAGDVVSVTILLKFGAESLLMRPDRFGRFPHHCALTILNKGKKSYAQPNIVLDSLRKSPAVLQMMLPYLNEEILFKKDIYGKNALHYAAELGTEETLMLLLEKGFSVLLNEVDKYGKTPLHSAAIFANIPALRVLLKYKAQTDVRSKVSEQTAFQETLLKLGRKQAEEIFSPYMSEQKINEQAMNLSLPDEIAQSLSYGLFGGYAPRKRKITELYKEHSVVDIKKPRLNMVSFPKNY